MGTLHEERYSCIVENLTERPLLSFCAHIYGSEDRYVDLCSEYETLAQIHLESIAGDLYSDKAKLNGWAAEGRLLDGGHIRVRFYEEDLLTSVDIYGKDGEQRRCAWIDLDAENPAPNFVFVQERDNWRVVWRHDDAICRSFIPMTK